VTRVFESKDIEGLCLQVHQLARKHGQLRQATTTMVEKVMSFIEKVGDDQEKKIKMIESLREVTEGKVSD
jgi:26S proteasome regulatory subunit N5